MRLLALDTSTEACSVALLIDQKLDFRSAIIPQQHAHQILLMLEDLLKANHVQVKDFDAIVFGEGPGSFTGLRIAAGVAQGLAFAHYLPLIPVSSLAALAYKALVEFPTVKYVISMLDARMQEVYFALYEQKNDAIETIIPAAVMRPEKALAQFLNFNLGTHWAAVGTSFKTYHEAFKELPQAYGWLDQALPSAEYLIQLGAIAFERGEMVSVTEALPKYVREKFLG